MNAEKMVYTKSDIRKMLDVGSRTIERMVRDGRLPKPFCKSPLRWNRETIDQWRMRQEAASERSKETID